MKNASESKKLAANKTELAKLLGIHARTITRDVDRFPHFPRPLVVGKGLEIYIIEEVVSFYRNQKVTA